MNPNAFIYLNQNGNEHFNDNNKSSMQIYQNNGETKTI